MLHSWLQRRYGTLALGTATALVLSTATQVSARPLMNVIDAGILEISSHNPNVFETVVPAIVQIQTDEPLRVEVLPAYLGNGPDRDPSGTERVVTVRQGGQRASSQGGDRTLELPVGTTELEISIQVERPSQFILGHYTYLFSLALTD